MPMKKSLFLEKNEMKGKSKEVWTILFCLFYLN
jgi:hypothetical protein